MGRANLSPVASHRMFLGKGSAAMIPGSPSRSTFVVGTASACFFRNTYSPRGVCLTNRSAGVLPWAALNPTAVLVGLPCGSNAAFLGGPWSSTTWAGLPSATSLRRSASRRGVEKSSDAPAGMSFSSRAARTRRSRSASAGPRNEAGISSVPISRSSCFIASILLKNRDRINQRDHRECRAG